MFKVNHGERLDLINYYSTLHSVAGENLEKSTLRIAELGTAHQIIDDVVKWQKILEPRPEVILLSRVVQELQLALYLNSVGLYRASLSSIRLALELALGFSYFSVQRLELAEWIKGTCDLYWSRLTNEDSGVLSLRFADAFLPELKGSVLEYRHMAIVLYRELSEYVHGNTHASESIPKKLSYSEDLENKVFDSLDTFADIFQFALCLRFENEISARSKLEVENCIIDRLGHIPSLRERFNKQEVKT